MNFKKAIAGGLTALMLNSCYTYKTLTHENFIRTDSISENIENYKSKEILKYDIEKTNFNPENKALEILIGKNTYEQKIALGYEIKEDKYKVIKEKKKHEMGYLELGALFGLFVGIIASNTKDITEENIIPDPINYLWMGPVAGSALGFFMWLIDLAGGPSDGDFLGRNYSHYKDPYYKTKNRRNVNFERVVEEKVIKTEYEPVKININADGLSLNEQKDSLSTVTDKDGTAHIKLKSLDENVFLTEKEFENLKLIKDLEYLGKQETIGEIKNKMKDVNYKVIISTESSKEDVGNDKKNLDITGHKVSLE